MELLAHITEMELFTGPMLFLGGVAVGFVIAFAIWGRPSHRHL